MKPVLFVLAMMLPLAAQAPKRALVPGVALATERIPQKMLANLETVYDGRLESMNTNDPIDILGGTRGLYVAGYGTVFTSEVSLIVTPGGGPIHPDLNDAFKAKVRQRKLANLPRLERLMKDLMHVTAITLVTLPADEQIVMAMRVRYLMWEDTTGLPAQILMTATKKAAMTDDVKMVIE